MSLPCKILSILSLCCINLLVSALNGAAPQKSVCTVVNLYLATIGCFAKSTATGGTMCRNVA